MVNNEKLFRAEGFDNALHTHWSKLPGNFYKPEAQGERPYGIPVERLVELFYSAKFVQRGLGLTQAAIVKQAL